MKCMYSKFSLLKVFLFAYFKSNVSTLTPNEFYGKLI